MKWHIQWPAFVLALVGVVFFAADRLTRTPAVVHSVSDGRQEISIPAARDGHYYLEGSVNGVPLRFMVDTGATYVSVSEEFARKAKLPEGITGYFSTANGNVEGRIVKGQVIEAEGFRATGLSVAVTPLGGKQGLLGQNFLRRFEVSQSRGEMRLRLAE
ncbi:MAG: retroviral-like aspartic protease family protein [Betaproteobacteria bacterium]|nr:retroviral-like aspartic protease family protein [Betaproteobacteria bacterium]MDH5222299.1 retroviral-like aspartic protease family protein [Betaproteobacteria bacterium]MDH5351018.1 retroviral-like aspartic protease family protein [Betaproteobacteria bacterium]